MARDHRESKGRGNLCHITVWFCCPCLFALHFSHCLPLSLFPASDRSLESRVTRMKGQGSSCQSQLDDTKATVERLRSLSRQYERQVQDTRQLLERARLDLDRSGSTLGRVVRAPLCDTLLVQPSHWVEKVHGERKNLTCYSYDICFVSRE